MAKQWKKQENPLVKYKPENMGKVPPHNAEAEQSLLGSILLKTEVFDTIESTVTGSDFYEPRHQLIYDAMKELSSNSRPIDTVTVSEVLKKRGQMEICGGATYLSSLADSIPTYAHAKEYAVIVREKAILRNLIDLSTEIVEASYRDEMSADDILQNAESILTDVTRRKQRGDFREVSALVGEVYEQIIARSKNPDLLLGLSTGFAKLDDYTQGLQGGQLIIIAARPSLGKTSLALNITYRLALEGRNILFFSFEMTSGDLIRRLLSVGSHVDQQKIRMGRIDSEDKSRLIHVLGQLSDTNITIDTSDNNVLDMKAKARTLQSELKKKGKKLDMMVVDYLQLVRPNDTISREQQIATISRALKTIALEMNIPVVALSQLSRDVEKREKSPDKSAKPKLSDLRESGAIEQDADVVIFIHRETKEEAMQTETSPSGTSVDRKALKCKFLIEKNRSGPTGEQQVWFIPSLTVFEPATERDSDEGDYGPSI
ncbi:MAG: replicative DNA helicase [Spirochaetia bacterium]|nr:replicative DNA helicase [Spirochaetia bacterium]